MKKKWPNGCARCSKEDTPTSSRKKKSALVFSKKVLNPNIGEKQMPLFFSKQN